MAQILVRNLDDAIRDRLRALAQQHGRSMEEEVRHILRAAAFADSGRTTKAAGSKRTRSRGGVAQPTLGLGDPTEIGLGTWAKRRFDRIGLRPHEQIQEIRGAVPQVPDFSAHAAEDDDLRDSDH